MRWLIGYTTCPHTRAALEAQGDEVWSCDLRAEAVENFKRLAALPYPKAIENPAPSFISSAYRPPDQTIQPYEFGENASKRTGLWLDRLPLLVPTMRVPGRFVEWPRGSGKLVERWANQTDSGQNRLSPNDDRWLERSKTYPGIANAFGDQWGREFQTDLLTLMLA